MNLSSINTNTTEGRLFFAALAMLTTTDPRRDKEPDVVLQECIALGNKIYENAVTPGAIVNQEALEVALMGEKTFERELTHLLNRYSKENDSDTPDYLLQQFLSACLATFNTTLRARDKWHGIDNIWQKTAV